jgi:hypothetical protein
VFKACVSSAADEIRTAKSCGPDAPLLASSLVEVHPPNRARDAPASARRRCQQSLVAGESTKETVKTIAQGKPDCFR